MTFGPKRGSALYIFDNFFKDFGLMIIAIIVAIASHDMTMIYQNAGVIIIVLAGPFIRITAYLCTYYSIDDTKLFVKSGWLNKRTVEIPIASITTVDFSQNILQQAFHVYKIKIDNASNIDARNGATKIKMTFGKEDAILIHKLLGKGSAGIDGFNIVSDEATAGQEGLSQQSAVSPADDGGFEAGGLRASESSLGRRYHIESKAIVLMGLLQAKMLLALQAISLICAGFVAIDGIVNFDDDAITMFLVNLVDKISGTLTAAIGIVILYIILLIVGLIKSVIVYYNFTLVDMGESLHIEYGLFTKKTYTLMKNKISGFTYEQPFLMKMFKLGTLGVFAIGYGDGGDDDKRESAIICPILKEDKYLEFIEEIMPEIVKAEEYAKPKASSIRYFFLNFGFIFSLFILAGTIVTAVLVPFLWELIFFGVLVVAYAVFGTIRQYMNSGIYANETCMSLTGGGMKKHTTVLKTVCVESVTEKGSIFKRRRGVVTVQLGYLAPLTFGNRSAKNVPAEMYTKAQEQLIF